MRLSRTLLITRLSGFKSVHYLGALLGLFPWLMGRVLLMGARFEDHLHDLEFGIKEHLVIVLEIELKVLLCVTEHALDDTDDSPISDL